MLKRLQLFWRIISDVDTSITILGWVIPSSISQIVVGLMLGILGILGSWLLEYGFVIAFILGCVGLVSGAWFVKAFSRGQEIKAVEPEKVEVQESTVAVVERVPSWFRQLLSDQRSEYRRFILVEFTGYWFRQALVREPYMELRFSVFNGSAFDIQLDESITGQIAYQSTAFLHTPVVTGSNFTKSALKPGRRGNFALRQEFNNTVSDYISRRAGTNMEFSVSHIRLQLHMKLPDDIESIQVPLELPALPSAKVWPVSEMKG